MQAIILHKPGKSVAELQKGLENENVKTKSKIWWLGKKLDPGMFEANAILIHIEASPSTVQGVLIEIRKKQPRIPLIIVDKTIQEDTKKQMLEKGADFYIAPPLNYRDLAIQLKHLVCAKAIRNGNKWMHAFDLWLDLEHRMARRHNQLMQLCNKEFMLLEFFIINRGKVITRNSLFEYVWDRNASFSSNTIDVHINRLRRKIDDPFKTKLIHTVHCIGYIFDKKKY